MPLYLVLFVVCVFRHTLAGSSEGDFSGPGKTFIRHALYTDEAPKPVGPYR